MKLAVVCNRQLKKEWLHRPFPPEVSVVFFEDIGSVGGDIDALFDLSFSHTPERMDVLRRFLSKPVFINAVALTLSDLQVPFVRINAWPGFLERSIAELAVLPAQRDMAKAVFAALNWPCELLPDVPGMVTARVLAMIINEAWFTFGEGVSSKEEIDIAMKLGTNYPYGPFEWGEKIGLNNVGELLQRLAKEDKQRYEPAPALAEALKTD
jgi:3-hydroxybutyryl-CoA dehydrogenase